MKTPLDKYSSKSPMPDGDGLCVALRSTIIMAFRNLSFPNWQESIQTFKESFALLLRKDMKREDSLGQVFIEVLTSMHHHLDAYAARHHRHGDELHKRQDEAPVS